MLSLLRKNPFAFVSSLVWAMSTTILAQAAAPAECPQPRFTGKAPDEYYSRVNPVAAANANPKAAAPIFQGTAGPVNCAICHGRKGDGRGTLSSQYDPPPRNFACAMTITGVPDGQLFWIIRFGSPGTAMPPHPSLTDEEVWQMVLYLRQLAK
jgi:mono/diheme cytochrome c family protein